MRGHGKEMMHDKAMRLFGAVISSLVCGAFVACAGADTPPVDDPLENAINQNFGNGAVAGGTGGSSATGSAGTPATPRAGSGGSSPAANPPANPDREPPVASAGSAGAPAEEPPADDDPPASTGGGCDGFAVLNEHCNGGSCHGDGGLGNFAASEEAALSFVGVSGSATCAAEGPLLNPDNPRQSVIIQKVLGTATCGAQMPLGVPLEEEDITCLEDWIATL
jgi:hypothetical protein